MFYINGQFLSEPDAKISVLDLGLLRGYGVFEYFRTYNKRPFHLKEHLDRLEYSAQEIGLFLPESKSRIEEIIEELLKKNKYQESSIKILLTGGQSNDGLTLDGIPSLIIFDYPFIPLPLCLYQEGIHVCTSPILRSIPTCKTTHYIPALMALHKQKERAPQDVLYLNADQRILEASTSNFFAISGRQLITSASDEILFGVTREVVLNLGSDLFEIIFESLPYSQLPHIEEAFLTSSSRELLPIVQINDQKVGSGSVGEKTKELLKRFFNYTQSQNFSPMPIARHLNIL